MKSFIFVFQNYVYVPIISAIIGFLLPLGYTKLKKIFTKIIAKRSDSINIEGSWNSSFVEANIIATESVEIKQTGRIVTASMSMKDRTYDFTGEFYNQTLIGTYVSKNNRADERGTIVLKHINDSLMSGYCTFIYQNKQVYNSPYTLTLSSNHKADSGTYPFCNSCVGKFDCCCTCESIDMPILLPFEVDALALKFKKNANYFSTKLTNNLYQMKRVDEDEKKECIFFVNNQCSIYNNRPIDCRLFPFDFKQIDGEYWVIYYNKPCNALPTEKKEIINCGYNMKPLLEIVLPYMSECSDPVFSKRLSSQEYIKLFPVSQLRDDTNL